MLQVGVLSRLLQGVAPVLNQKRGQPTPLRYVLVEVRLTAPQKTQAKLLSVLHVLCPQLVS